MASFTLAACSKTKTVSMAEAKSLIEEYFKIAEVPGLTIKEVKDDQDFVYSIVVDYQGQEFTSYMTKDGKKFFQAGADIDLQKMKQEKEAMAKSAPVDLKDLPKQDKPKVELFVMSHCPYGTQIEKGILPAVKTLSDKIDFKVKFVNYAMHGEKELREELTQYCLQEQDQAKYLSYLECFLKDETGSKTCLSQVGADQAALDTCVSETDAKYKVTANMNDKNTFKGNYPSFLVYDEDNNKYGIQGSPSLVINEKNVDSSQRDASNLLTALCAGFSNEPDVCKTKLSTDVPNPGFGEGSVAGSTTDTTAGSCN